MSLLRPDGTLQASKVSSVANFNLSTQALATSGTYRVVVDPTASRTGAINVAVTSP